MLPVMSIHVVSTYRHCNNAITFFSRRLIHSVNSLPVPPELIALETSEDAAKARSWADEFRKSPIPRDHVELHFSRSSGPGGQNVNKVNTKATVKCPLNSPWIPAWAKAGLRQSPHYVASSHSVQISSTTTRSQAQNVDDCLTKLHSAIMSASTAPIKNEPSKEQRRRVEMLKHLEKGKRKVEKKHRSEVKRSRSNRDWF